MSVRIEASRFYLRDLWVSEGREFWARRSGEFLTLADAKREAKRLAKGIGRGARVQIVRVSTAMVAEVKP